MEEVAEDLVAKVILHVSRHADEGAAHGEAEVALEEGRPENETAVEEEPGEGDSGLEIVNGGLQDPGGEEGEDVRQHEKDQARGQTAAVSRDEGPDGPVVFDQHHALGESSSMDLQVEKRIVAR